MDSVNNKCRNPYSKQGSTINKKSKITDCSLTDMKNGECFITTSMDSVYKDGPGIVIKFKSNLRGESVLCAVLQSGVPEFIELNPYNRVTKYYPHNDELILLLPFIC